MIRALSDNRAQKIGDAVKEAAPDLGKKGLEELSKGVQDFMKTGMETHSRALKEGLLGFGIFIFYSVLAACITTFVCVVFILVFNKYA
jgi:CHASE3 domain sensor protein